MRRFWCREGNVDEVAWAAHEERAGALVAEALANVPSNLLGGTRVGEAWVDRVFSSPPQVAGSVLMLLVRVAASTGLPFMVTMTVNDLSRRQWTVSREDAFLAVRTGTRSDDDYHCNAGWAFKVSEVLLRRTAAGCQLTDDETQTIRAAITSLESRVNPPGPERREIRARLARMLPVGQAGTVDTAAIVPV